MSGYVHTLIGHTLIGHTLIDHTLIDHTLVDHTPADEGRSVLIGFLFDGVSVQSLNLSASPQVSEDTYAHPVKKLFLPSTHAMTVEDELLIETYVHRPGALTAAERRRAEALMEENEEARAWAAVLRPMYAELEKGKRESLSQAVDDFVRGLFEPPLVLAVTQAGHAQPTILAADAGPTARFESMAVLSSTANGVLVRILHDTQRDEGRVYVLAENEKAYRHALFESADEEIHVPLRKNGTGRFSEASRVAADALKQGRIRRCLWQGPLVLGETPSSMLQGTGGYAVRAEWVTATTLRLHATTRNADRPALRWVGVDHGDTVDVVAFEDQTAEVSVTEDDRDRTLRLFA